MTTTNSKGKGRAPPITDSAEQAPLLSSSTSTPPKINQGRGPLIDSDDEDSQYNGVLGRRRNRRNADGTSTSSRNTCLSICGALSFTLLLVAAITHIWLGHLLKEQSKNGNNNLQLMGQRGLVFDGPSRFGIKEGIEGGLLIELEGKIGVNAKKSLGWEGKESGNWFKRREDSIARWFTSTLDVVGVEIGVISLSGSKDDGEEGLILVQEMDKIMVPLSYPTSNSPDIRLDELVLSIPISFPSPSALGNFAQKVWESKHFSFKIGMKNLVVRPKKAQGLVKGLMRKWGTVKVKTMTTKLVGKVPGLPSDPATLVELERYDIFQSTSETNETTVGIAAIATLFNPFSNSSLLDGKLNNLAWGNPFRIPVSLYLPASHDGSEDEGEKEILLAKVTTSPFAFAAGSNSTTISILGRLVSLATSSTSAQTISNSLSEFLANYLAGKENTILLRYDPSPPADEDGEETTGPYPPPFVSTMLESLTVSLPFPGSKSKVELFRNLRIEEMKIRLASFTNPLHSFSNNEDSLLAFANDLVGVEEPEGDLLCSGRVVGEILLPEEFSGLMELIDVAGILPDVYVYDGDLPHSSLQFSFAPSSQLPLSSSTDLSTLSTYPPSPVPANAFARLRPSSLIPSQTIHIPANSTNSAATYLTATFLDAPLFLLPGRSDVFRKFVGKVIFGGGGSEGVKAGVRGITGVKVDIGGFGEVGIEGVEIEGVFFVGKGGIGGI